MFNLKLLIILIISINAIGFVLIGIDKYKSKHRKWRIKEKTFFIIAVLGGTIGVFLGMHIFRHKTQHTSFVIGIPIIFILQISLIYIFSKHPIHL